MRLTNFMFARAPIHKLALLYSADSFFKVLVPRFLRSADLYINKHISACQHRFSETFWQFRLRPSRSSPRRDLHLTMLARCLSTHFCVVFPTSRPPLLRFALLLFQLYSRHSRFFLRRPVGGRSTILTKHPAFVNTLYSPFFAFSKKIECILDIVFVSTAETNRSL